MPLFSTFIIFNIHSYNTIIHSFILQHLPRPYIFIGYTHRKRRLHGVPSRESNSGLPYSKPMHYHLSYTAP